MCHYAFCAFGWYRVSGSLQSVDARRSTSQASQTSVWKFVFSFAILTSAVANVLFLSAALCQGGKQESGRLFRMYLIVVGMLAKNKDLIRIGYVLDCWDALEKVHISLCCSLSRVPESV